LNISLFTGAENKLKDLKQKGTIISWAGKHCSDPARIGVRPGFI